MESSIDRLFRKIDKAAEGKKLADFLSDGLSGSEFTSLMLEVYARRADHIAPAELLQNFRKSRFLKPPEMDALGYLQTLVNFLTIAKKHNFHTRLYGPLAPFGSCSVLAPVNQKKVISSIRGTEVVADVTNLMAIDLAADASLPRDLVTIHRLVRGQALEHPDHTAHFGLLAFASAGHDVGNRAFETQKLVQHISLHIELYRSILEDPNTSLHVELLSLHPSGQTPVDKKWLQPVEDMLIKEGMSYVITPSEHQAYYHTCQFKIDVEKDGKRLNISDGGFVNWTQTLLNNQKSRLCISALGSELLYRCFIQPPQKDIPHP